MWDFQENPTRPLSRDRTKPVAVIAPLGVLRLTQNCAFRILDGQTFSEEEPVYQVYLYPAYNRDILYKEESGES